MSKLPKHYSLVKEHPHSYEIHDKRDEKKFHIAKKDLSLQMHGKLAGIPKYSAGTLAVGREEVPTIQELTNEQNGGNGATGSWDDSNPSAAVVESPEQATPPPPSTNIPNESPKGPIESTLDLLSKPAAPMSQFESSQKAMEKGITDMGRAQGDQAKETSEAMAASNWRLQGALNEAKADQDAFEWKNQKLAEQVAAANIDPNQYIHNMSTGNKILAAIAMGLGGAGAAMSGQKNLASEAIDNAIQRDIEAQKVNLGKKQSLLSQNLEKHKDMRTAQQATFMQMHAMAQGQVAQIAAKHGGAIDQAKTQMLLGQMQQSGLEKRMQLQQMVTQQKIRESLAQASAGNSPIQEDPAKYVPHVVPEAHQEPVYKEIERAANTRRMADSINNAFEDAVKANTIAKTMGGLRDNRSTHAFHQAMQPTFADLEGTVRQAAMDNTFKNLSPTLSDTENDIQIKREAKDDYLRSKASAPRAKSFGIDLDKFATTGPAARRNPKEGQTASDDKGNRVVMKNGKWVPVGR